MSLTVRTITESDIDSFRTKLGRAFGADPHTEDRERFVRIIDLERAIAAFDGSDLVGTCATFPRRLSVPGGSLPMAGTTMVTVQPTHRRRGAMRAMLRWHLEDARDRGEPLASLWASESSIYGRFGYGPAAYGHDVRVSGKAIRFAAEPPRGRVRTIELDEAARLLPAVYERLEPLRAGVPSRPAAWWETRVLADPEHRRMGRSAKRVAVYEDGSGGGPGGGSIGGYIIYQQKLEWMDSVPKGEVFVLELIAATADAHHALWRFVTSIDLFGTVTYWNAPIDDELPWLLTEPRQVQRRLTDTLWVRLVNIETALSGRGYRHGGRLALGVRDPFMPGNEGTFALEVDEGGTATCARTRSGPDVELAVQTLGALYLGGQRVSSLARAGLIRGSPPALATAERLFAWDPAPWCPEVF